MRMHYLLNLLRVSAVFFYHGAIAQDSMSDSAFYQKALSNTRSVYFKNIGANSSIYNGTAYDHYWNRVTGHPFFNTEQFLPGIINYDGTVYEDLPFVYDMLQDVVVTKTFTKNADIRLETGRVRFFWIGTHYFVRLVKDSSNTSIPVNGFYEQLYAGNFRVFLKYEKKIKQSINASDNTTSFIEYKRYYVEKNKTLHLIESEGDLLLLCNDQKREIRKFLNRRDISFKKDPSKAIVQTVMYYEQLKNKYAL